MNISLRLVFENFDGNIDFTSEVFKRLKPSNKFLKLMREKLGLLYFPGTENANDHCFQSLHEIQSEYKFFFTRRDLINYISKNLKHENIDSDFGYVKFPESVSVFFCAD